MDSLKQQYIDYKSNCKTTVEEPMNKGMTAALRGVCNNNLQKYVWIL